MCGLCGIYNRDGKPVDKSLIKRMNNKMISRGPDAEGFKIEANMGFGFRRLSIIDLEGGAQPLFNEDKTLWLVMNGEIYN